MSYKRLELYVGWTCNQNCTYCIEYPTMLKMWNVKVTKTEILKKLLKYKMLGYNHVTYLGGEPFIQGVFLDALKIGKKLGYKILVTTNCTTLHIDTQASKFLPYIDELILSVEALEIEEQQKISRTKNFVHWEKVFENIKKYWNGYYLKANIVITQDNKNKLFDIVVFLNSKGLKNIAITYPDINLGYGKKIIKKNIAPKYGENIKDLLKIFRYCKENNINLKIVDIPFCIFPKEEIGSIYKITDDFDYESRLKVSFKNEERLRGEEKLVRDRRHIDKCTNCKYIDICEGPGIEYGKIYGFDEINTIL